MTAQVSVGSSPELVTLAFGVNEIASSLIIAKHVGSIISRPQDAQIFNVFETRFKVRVRRIPVWLEQVTFGRTAMIHGENLRRIKESSIMNDVDIRRLEGIATLVVLITKYVEDKNDVAKLLEHLLLGALGRTVDKGDLEGVSLPYSLKPMLRPFIEATLQSDSETSQTKKAFAWVSELSMITGYNLKENKPFARNRQMTINVVSELLGGPSVEEELKTQRGYTAPADLDHNESKVFDTLSFGPAYIALTARANGVDSVVEVIQSNSRKHLLPKQARVGTHTFVVRLWLCQPPPEVRNILRYSAAGESAAYLDINDGGEFENDEEMTIFGGTMELSVWAARKAGFEGESLQAHVQELAIPKLWNEGQRLVENCRWTTRKISRSQYPLRFQLDVSSISTTTVPAVVSELAKLLDRKYEQLRTISRPIANLVHQIYKFDTYSLDDSLTGEFLAAMSLVATSFAVHSLHMITNLPEAEIISTQYALNLMSLSPGGGISELLFQALSANGVNYQKLLWAAATLWGGASHKTQGSAIVDDGVFGIVAPHCTVLMDILRDPLQFIRLGMSSKLLTICRGAVPMLPRDPRTGFLKTEQHAGNKSKIVNYVQNSHFPQSFEMRTRSTINYDHLHPTVLTTNSLLAARFEERGQAPTLSELIITFEPVIMNPSRGLFCAWYMGNLAFELDPRDVFVNVLKRPFVGNGPEMSLNSNGINLTPIPITHMDLLEKGHFEVEEGYGIFDCCGQVGWAVAIAGLVNDKMVFCRNKIDRIPSGMELGVGDVLMLCSLEE